jgi:outer membrane protein TolC
MSINITSVIMSIRAGLWVALMSVSIVSHAQRDSLFILPDTAKAFTLENFYYLILQNHPTAKQVDLLTDIARQEIRLARGNFDPKLEVSYLQKNFKGTEYYDLFDGALKFPSVLPFDPKIGVERNQGQFVNPENYISDEFNYQQFYAGITVPLGRGLITDDRRAALRQAELFGDMTQAEQVKLLNKLLLESAKDYWQWYFAYNNYRILNRGVSIAAEIFRRVKLSAEFGEAAVIDTVQAKITLQERLVQQQEALLDFQNAGIQLSTYLWDSLSNPLSLPLQWAPVRAQENWNLSSGALEELKEQAKQNHPELRKLTVKLEQLDVERRLAIEYLKPRLDASYNFLNQPFDPDFNTSLSLGENYKFGVDFSFPLFIRKERAKLAQTKIKISSTRFEQDFVQRQVLNQIDASFNQLFNTGIIINQLDDMVANYERILQAEFLNLENGESDLFKINIQQEKLIQAQSKYLKMLSEYEKNKALLYWAAGVRNLGLDNNQ